MTCKYEEFFTDWVDYGSTRVPMTSSDCKYEGNVDISNADCDPSCPCYIEAREL